MIPICFEILHFTPACLTRGYDNHSQSLVWNFKKVLEKENPDTAAAALVHSSCKYHSHSGIRQGSCLSAYEPAQLQQKWFLSKVADPQNYPQKSQV